MTSNDQIKMTNDEIKEALERYVILYGKEIYIADNIKVADVLDLINRLEEENEQWQSAYMTQKQEIANLEIEFKAMRGAANSYKAENKKLSTLAKLGNMRANDYRVMRDRALKAEKEIERLKKTI